MILVKKEKMKLFAYENGNKIAKVVVFKDDIMTTKVISIGGSIIDFNKKIKISNMARNLVIGDLEEMEA